MKVLPRVPFTYVNTNVIKNVIAEEQQTYKRTWDSHNSSTNEPGVRTYKNQCQLLPNFHTTEVYIPEGLVATH